MIWHFIITTILSTVTIIMALAKVHTKAAMSSIPVRGAIHRNGRRRRFIPDGQPNQLPALVCTFAKAENSHQFRISIDIRNWREFSALASTNKEKDGAQDAMKEASGIATHIVSMSQK
eukprot:14726294-Ditylum_brightwellii.AAC.1